MRYPLVRSNGHRTFDLEFVCLYLWGVAASIMLTNRDVVSFSKFFKVAFLFGLIFLVNTSHAKQSLSLFIDSNEGGQFFEKRRDQLKQFLINKKCDVRTIKIGNEHQSDTKYDLIFKPLKKKLSSDYIQQLSIKIVDNTPLTASIMVRKSTGIQSLESLNNIHIALLSDQSELGYWLPLEIFDQAGITFSKHKITFTQNNLAAASLLMHKDVFAAVIATPLANRWAVTNDLIMVRKTRELVAGGIWFHKNISDQTANLCSKAFTSLNQSDRRNKKLLSIFPGWVESFVIFSNEVRSTPPPKN